MSEYNQILLMYNELDLEFRGDPTDSTDLNASLTEVENKKEIWWAPGFRTRGGVGNYLSQAWDCFKGGHNNHRRLDNPFRPTQIQGQYNSNRAGSGGIMATGYQSNATTPQRNQFNP